MSVEREKTRSTPFPITFTDPFLAEQSKLTISSQVKAIEQAADWRRKALSDLGSVFDLFTFISIAMAIERRIPAREIAAHLGVSELIILQCMEKLTHAGYLGSFQQPQSPSDIAFTKRLLKKSSQGFVGPKDHPRLRALYEAIKAYEAREARAPRTASSFMRH